MRITSEIIVEERAENKEKKIWVMKSKNCKVLKEVEVSIIYIFFYPSTSLHYNPLKSYLILFKHA